MDATKLKAWLPFDESATADKCGNTWTATGNVSLDTTITKFGGASVHLPSNAYLTANNVIDLNADKWTFDAWAYLVSSTGDDGFIALSEGASRRGLIACADGVWVASSGGGSWQKSNSSLLFPSVKNQWVHLAIVKNGTTVTFYQDGVAVWLFETSELNNNGVFILGGSSYGYGNDIYFDEVRFFEGAALWTENFTPPTAEDYDALALELDSQIDFTVDVQRRISNIVEFTADVQRTIRTTWRYINLGTADTLTISGTTLTNRSATQSKTGTAFYQTTRAKCFDLPATDEVWIKFDVYFNGSNRWRAYNGGSNGSSGVCSQTDGQLSFFSNSTNAGDFSNVCKSNQLQTVLLHMVSGSSAGIIEAWVNGTKIYTYAGDVNHGQDFADIYLQSDGSGTFFSNVIISNREISLNDGYISFSADVQRKLSNVVEFTADVRRDIVQVINVPFLFGEHFNHCCSVEYDAPTTSIGRPLKIKLPNKSKAYVHATALNGGAFKVFSDTDAVGTVTGDVYAALDECESVFVQKVVAPQSILYMFLNSLRYRGGSALDSAIENCTYGVFPSKDELVNSFLNDLDNSESNLDFLSRCCGVDLSNDDTGAVIGSDAGGGYPKTAKSIVPEPVPVEDWIVPEKGSSKIIEGLTVNFPTSGYKGTFTDAENHILAGLNSVWIEQALLLIQRSCNIDFRTNQTNIVHDISVKFVDENNDALAYVSITTKDGSTTSLELRVNMRRYSGINMTSEDGAAGSNTYLDRVLAHEMTHAVMAARIKNYTELPRFLREGIAEFIHGIDDERKSDIQYLTQTAQRNTLQSIFSTGGDSGDINIYSAGYLFFRYMIKQTLEKGTFPLERYSSTGHIRLFISDGAVDYFGNALTDNTRASFSADIQRELVRTTSFNADVAIFDTIQIEFDADINRAIKGKVRLFAIDTSEYFSGGTHSAETLTPVVIPSQETIPAAPDNTIGLQSIEISLSEQQLTDNVSFVGVVPFDIMYPVKGQYLDYVFDMRVERVQQKGTLYSCECCADIDQLLYTQIAYTVPPNIDWHDTSESTADGDEEEEEKYYTLIEHAFGIAGALGKAPIVQLNNLETTIKPENLGGATYADMIREVFGWSSRVPTHMINVFIRDDKIFFVQRGHEARLIDLTETKHTIPTITHELVRMTWGSTPWSKTETRERTSSHFEPVEYDYSDVYDPNNSSIPTPQDGDEETWVTVEDFSTGLDWVAWTTYHYYPKIKGFAEGSLPNALGGLLAKVVISKHTLDLNEPDSYTEITHGYDEDKNKVRTVTTVHYSGGSDKPPDTMTINLSNYITLPNGEKFLAKESTQTFEDGELVDSTTTTHSPGRQGQTHAIKISNDGEIAGEVFGQNTGDDRVTPFSQNKAASLENGKRTKYRYNSNTGEWEKVGEWVDETTTEQRTLNGLSLYDSSFPIHGEDALRGLTEAIKWLNRRTKETVTFTLYEYPHLIDFNDRIIFNGAQYFLVSNIATTNARIFNEQRISIVRWY